jgi:hypothetical protein
MTHCPIGNPPALLRPILAAAFSLVLLACARPAAAEIKVEKKPPVVERKTFDPANRPKEMPELHGHELAVTASQYDCVMGFSTEMTQRMLPKDRALVVYSVRRVTVSLSLKITIWLPEGANERLKAHEEGHRAIAERAYQNGEALARKAANRIDGRRVVGEAESLDKAEQIAGGKVKGLSEEFTKTYREALVIPVNRVQDIYDELTGHGTKSDPDVQKAIELAFARQSEEAKKGTDKPTTAASTTRPATRPTATTRPAQRN